MRGCSQLGGHAIRLHEFDETVTHKFQVSETQESEREGVLRYRFDAMIKSHAHTIHRGSVSSREDISTAQHINRMLGGCLAMLALGYAEVEAPLGALLPAQGLVTPPNVDMSCPAALAWSEKAYHRAAQALGVACRSFAVQEQQPMWRQIVARTVGPPMATVQRDMIYWIEPKSAHSTIVNHLLQGAPFEGSEAAWDARHTRANASELIRLGPKVSAARELAKLAAERAERAAQRAERFAEDATEAAAWDASSAAESELPPYEWTFVREPLGHFIAGFDEVETYYVARGFGTGGVGGSSGRTSSWAASRWAAAHVAGRPVAERAAAMLADLLGQLGPVDYLAELVHIVPQTLGFSRALPARAARRASPREAVPPDSFGGSSFGVARLGAPSLGTWPSGASPPGEGFRQLDFVGRIEDMDASWANVTRALGIKSAPAQPHASTTRTALSPHVGSHVNPQHSRRAASEKSLQLLMHNSGATADSAGQALADALCAILQREYACLGARAYEPPRRCAWARESARN